MDVNILETFLLAAGQFAIKIIAALLIWFIGRWVVGLLVKMMKKYLDSHQIDPTLVRYLGNIVVVLLNIILIIIILGLFGIQTTSFAAVLAAIGLAIGLAWSGLLGNFAAGAFLVVLRPFKVGDFITAGGTTGTVKEIGLFVTTLTSPDNIEVYVGNNVIFTGTIQNFSTNPYRRVDRTAQLSHSVDPQEAIKILKDRLSQIPNVMENPAPEVEILEFNLAGPVLAVRPYCNNDHYWQVTFDTNRLIQESFGEAGFPVPEQHIVLRDPSK